MFIPSFFTGFLIRRVGEFGMIVSGLLLYVAAVVVLLQGFSFWHYFFVLMLNGFGWNALFVTGSAIVASVASPEERAKVQGFSDFMVTMAISTSALSAGALHYLIGWRMMGWAALLPVGIIAIVTLASRRQRISAGHDHVSQPPVTFIWRLTAVFRIAPVDNEIMTFRLAADGFLIASSSPSTPCSRKACERRHCHPDQGTYRACRYRSGGHGCSFHRNYASAA